MSFECVAEVFFPEEAEEEEEEGKTLLPGVPDPDDARNGGDVPIKQGIHLEGSTGQADFGVLEAGGQDEELPQDEFISVTSLALDQLPASIRSEVNLKFIQDISKRVVRVNNNCLSAERPERFLFPDQKSLKGSGIIFFIEGDIVIVSTNRHILYNDEEVKNSTIDLFFDRPLLEAYKAKEIRRVQRGRGLGTMRANQEEDFTLALFRLDKELVDHLKSLTGQDGGLPYALMSNKRAFPELYKQVPQTQYGHTTEKTVCVIGHPLGKHKRVSFGRMLEEVPSSRQYKHDAPTRQGSSGSPILVFSPSPSTVPPNSVWYHIGRSSPGSKVRTAHFQVNDSQLFDVDMVTDERFQLNLLSDMLDIPLLSVDLMCSWLLAEDFTRAVSLASASQRILSLGVCLSAALHELGTEEVRKVKEHFCSPIQNAIASQAASLHSGEPMTHLSTRMDEARGSCHCPTFVNAVTSGPAGSQSSISDEILLPPQTMPRGLRHRKTWPFGPETEVTSTAGHADGGDACIVEDIVRDLCQQDPNDKFIFAYFMTLLRRISEITASQDADDDVARSGLSPSAPRLEDTFSRGSTSLPSSRAKVKLMMTSLDFVEFGSSLYDATAMHIVMFGKQFLKVSEQIASLASQESQSSEDEGVRTTDQVSSSSTGDSQDSSQTSSQRTAKVPPLSREEQETQEDLRILLSHVHVHYNQSRRDTQEEAGNMGGCSCGRPNPRNLADAARHMRELLEKEIATGQDEQSPGATHHRDESQVARKAKCGVSTPNNGEDVDGDTKKMGHSETGKKEEGNRGAEPKAEEQQSEMEGSVFRKFLERLRTQLQLAIMASFFEDTRFEPGQYSIPELELSHLLATLADTDNPLRLLTDCMNTLKASFNSFVAYFCLHHSQKTPEASAEAGVAPEVVSSLREKLRDSLLFSRRFLAAVEVFLYDSRILLKRWHQDLGCDCGHFLDLLQSECSNGSPGQASEASTGRETTAAGRQSKADAWKGGIDVEQKRGSSGGPNPAEIIQGAMRDVGGDLGLIGSLVGHVTQVQTNRVPSKDAVDIELD